MAIQHFPRSSSTRDAPSRDEIECHRRPPNAPINKHGAGAKPVDMDPGTERIAGRVKKILTYFTNVNPLRSRKKESAF
jgi:hypothetical protein